MPTTNLTLTPSVGDSPSWSSVASAVGDDGSAATTNSSLAYLHINHNASSVIPSNATLGNIVVTIKARATWTGSAPDIYLRDVGTRTYSDGSPYRATLTTSFVTYTLVSDTAANLGITVANLHSDYIKFRTSIPGGTTTIFVDHVTMSVEWTASSGIPQLFIMEAF